jgi:hypothetical protein
VLCGANTDPATLAADAGGLGHSPR